MGLTGIDRIEEFFGVAGEGAEFDPMLQVLYKGLKQDVFLGGRNCTGIFSVIFFRCFLCTGLLLRSFLGGLNYAGRLLRSISCVFFFFFFPHGPYYWRHFLADLSCRHCY